ncbi:MAG: GxxExxY protein [Caldithrix sp.]|nr:MAG: GxxExxY protein [Caldithrix sp.]
MWPKRTRKARYHAEGQKWIDIFFKGEKLEEKYSRAILVANKRIVEFKTVPDLNDSHIRKLLTYLEAIIYQACPERSRKGRLCC